DGPVEEALHGDRAAPQASLPAFVFVTPLREGEGREGGSRCGAEPLHKRDDKVAIELVALGLDVELCRVEEGLGELGDGQVLAFALRQGLALLEDPAAVLLVGLGLRLSEALLLAAADLEVPGLLVFSIPGFWKHERALRIWPIRKARLGPGGGG